MIKKTKLILIGLVIVIIVISIIYLWLRQDQFGESQPVTLVSGGANWTSQQHKQLQQDLVNVIGKYTEAVLMTNAVFFTDIEKTDYQEWHQKVEDALDLWQEVEDKEKAIRSLLQQMDVVQKDQPKPNYNLTNRIYDSFLAMIAPQASADSTEGSDTVNPQPTADEIIAVFDSAEAGQKIIAIMDAFKVDKNEAMRLLATEVGQQAADYDKKGDTYERLRNGAIVIKNASKVAVFVGSNFIAPGAATAAVGVIKGGVIAINGISLAIDVGTDINIALGNEENAAVLKKASQTIMPVTEILSIASLQNIGDPSNLFYIADRTGTLADLAGKGCVWLRMDDADNLVVSRGQQPEFSQDEDGYYGLPDGYYNLNGEQVEVTSIDAELLAELYGEFASLAFGDSLILNGTISANPLTYTLPGIDERTHRMRGGGTMNLTITGTSVSGQCNISARDYWKCPPDAECGGDWLASAASPVNISGSVSGSFDLKTGTITGQVGEHTFTGKVAGNQAKGYFYYALPNGGSAFLWSANVSSN